MSTLEGYVEGMINLGGGGGSDVTITPTLETGTKIADFTVDEISGELYAPTPIPPVEYTAGNNITIEDGVISATDTTYTAGDNITIENGVISADVNESVNYSTDEQIIGTWIDGSPIYRKTIYFENGLLVRNNQWVSVGIVASSMNIERFIKAFSMGGIDTAGGSGFNINIGIVNSNISVYCDRNGDTIFIEYLTMEYTKTTD